MEQEIQHPSDNIMEQFAPLNEEEKNHQQKDGRISQFPKKKRTLIGNYDVITTLMYFVNILELFQVT